MNNMLYIGYVDYLESISYKYNIKGRLTRMVIMKGDQEDPKDGGYDVGKGVIKRKGLVMLVRIALILKGVLIKKGGRRKNQHLCH